MLPTEGNPDWHIQGDVLEHLNDGWDLMISFPPCTHLCSSGARWFPEKRADGRQAAAIKFFMEFVNAPVAKMAIENPIGIMSSVYRKPDCIIQPWEHNHAETKSTCLWLKSLPAILPSKVVEPDYMRRKDGSYYTDKKGNRYSRIHFMSCSSPNRAMERSRTYQGIADAMAEQWGDL